MYTLFIVDDEKIVIDGLTNTIQWEKHNITIVGSATDGEKALSEILEKKPQIVITDIRMPKMNGLELIKAVKTVDRDIVFVIFSGYSEFEYAKKAIELEAIDYLVKPIDLDEIICTVKKAIDKVNKNQKQKKNEYEIKKLEPVLKEKVYTDIILGKRPGSGFFDKNIIVEVICLNILHEKASNYNPEILEKVANPFLKKNIEVFTFKYNNDILILITNRKHTKTNINDSLKTALDEVSKLLLSAFSIENTYYGIGRQYEDVSLISQSYIEAKDALTFGTFFSKSITFFDKIKNRSMKECFTLNNYANNIEYFESDNIDVGSIERYMNNLVDNSIKVQTDPILFKRQIVAFLNEFEQNLKNRFEITLQDIFGEDFSYNNEIERQLSIIAIKELVEKVIRTVYDYIRLHKTSYKSRLIDNIKLFINENLNKNLTLNEISGKFNLSPAYLSTFFKSFSGEPMFDYMTRMRIEKSKELLRSTNYKIFEICDRLGYDNQRYFCQVFKKCVGISPSEYRNSYIKS